jgi:hypothetical protein
MCVVSMVMDHYTDKWRPNPWFNPEPLKPLPLPFPQTPPIYPQPADVITRDEINDLRRDIAELKALVKRAKKYDADKGEPNCELAEKVEIVRKVAKLVGIEISDVL